MINRRQLLKNLSLVFGGAVVAGSSLLQACTFKQNRVQLLDDDIALLDEIGDTIIPATADSPGAKAAGIGRYMQVMVDDCYSKKQRKAFIRGLDDFEEACTKKYNQDFTALSATDKKAFLMQLQAEAKAYNAKKSLDSSDAFEHYFTMIKELTIAGYFTSNIGATQAWRYQAIPGKYQGCIPYKKGDKPWATS